MSDDYVIGAVIGEGPLGPRFAGRYRPSGHPVALEEVPRALLDRPDFVERLAAAGRRAAAVKDPHVVAVYDLVQVGPRLYVVTELVRGRSLAALLGAERLLPLATAMTVTDSVLAGLAAVHRAGLEHGDIGPDTVLVTPAGGARIAELGVSAVLASDQAMPDWPAVVPPGGGAPSAAADLYATGALLREMVIGLRPEEEGGWTGPAPLGTLLSRCLDTLSARQPASAGDLRQELELAATELLGPQWRSLSDLGARAIRPLGLQAPRPRRVRSATASTPQGSPAPGRSDDPTTAASPLIAEGATVGQVIPGSGSGPRPPEPTRATVTSPAGWGPVPVRSGWALPAPEPTPAEPASTEQQSSELAPGYPRRGLEAAPPPPRRRRRRRLVAALVVLVILVIAGAAAALLVALKPPPPAKPATIPPLSVGSQVHLSVQPGTTGGCDTTFTFTATGTLSGAGTLTYRWTKSTTGGTPVSSQLSLTITPNEGSFLLTTPWKFVGPATLAGTVTFQVLSPQSRSATQTFHYSCAQ